MASPSSCLHVRIVFVCDPLILLRVRVQAPACCKGAPPGSTPSALIPCIFKLAQLGPGDTFVDLGCGAGDVVLAAAAYAPVRAGACGWACMRVCSVLCLPAFLSDCVDTDILTWAVRL